MAQVFLTFGPTASAGTANTVPVRDSAGDVSVVNGKVGCMLFSDFATVNNSGAGETTGYSHTLTAGILKTNGDAILCDYAFQLVSPTAPTVVVYFGTSGSPTSIYSFAPGSPFSDDVRLSVIIIRVSATTVRTLVSGISNLNSDATNIAGGLLPTDYNSVGSLTLANAQDLKLTLQDSSSNKVRAQMAVARYYPA